MSDRPLSGEPLALDLVNTEWPEHGRLRDYLAEPAALTSWLAEHAHEFGPVRSTDDAVLDSLQQTRRAIRRALEDQDYGELNAVLDQGRLRLHVDRTGQAVEHSELHNEAWRPAWVTARSFVDLLQSAPPDRLRSCAGPGCILWFLDTSRNGRRRWCSMEGCGNRAKARAHYAREQARETD